MVSMSDNSLIRDPESGGPRDKPFSMTAPAANALAECGPVTIDADAI